MNIGAQVAYLRKHKGWSLRDLSKRTGLLSISYLSDIEQGRPSPSLDTIERLAKAFDMSVPVFMGGADLDLTPDERQLLDAYRAGDVVGGDEAGLERQVRQIGRNGARYPSPHRGVNS